MPTGPPSAEPGPRGFGAVGMLTVHITLLLAVPSNLTVAGMGTYGRPAMLWGLVLLGWWVLWRLEGGVPPAGRGIGPARIAVLLLVLVILMSFAHALLRGQPADQISPAISALMRTASWCGVFLVAMDGLIDSDDVVRLVRRLVVLTGIVAALGLAQFATHRTFLAWAEGIPGMAFGTDDVASRGVFARAVGTATHPLEFGAVVVGMLPLAIAAAMGNGFRSGRRMRIGWWLPAGIAVLVALVSVSRSAIIGLVVAILASMPGMAPRARRILAILGVLAVAVVAVAVPGMATTVITLFTGAEDDPSTRSRAAALSRVPEFLSASPLLGAGFGTFLPRYYIFDDQWVLTLVELGIAGAAALAAVFLASGWSAVLAARRLDPAAAAVARASAASVLTLAVLYAFFDALGFPMSAGLLFLVAGLCAALYRMSTRSKTSVQSSEVNVNRNHLMGDLEQRRRPAPDPHGME
ncbi:hypothetical protein JS278_01524 [Acidipropionibacterium virtanenii]|uniref:O-antigen ligase-related domain-containing protein n=2 Tax=Acidipropionibacterium virtanenii TaxID=2057246 RepID=A0A344UTU0_9ACTN|nr:hypothetical protein JS278_01524 [Acidipropionibacterium virtanenii]